MADFVKYLLSWRFTDDGNRQSSIFWLPAGVEPNTAVADILNLVELSASEYGYEYKLDIADDLDICPQCNKKALNVHVDDWGDQVGNITYLNCRSCGFADVS